MPNDTKEAGTVKFKFTRNEGYRIIHANGVWGGFTPRGEFLMEFFIETPQKIDTITHELQAEGKIGKEIDRNPKQNSEGPVVNREIQSAVVMSPDTAKSLMLWIQDKLKDIEKIRGGKNNGS